MKRLILGVLASVFAAGCGGASTQCQTVACANPPSSKAFQACTTTGTTTVTYSFGGISCQCDAANAASAMCVDCDTKRSAYCTM